MGFLAVRHCRPVTSIFASAALIVLGGCTHYEASPVSIANVAGRYSERSMSLEAAAARCAAMAPRASCDAAHPDKLVLFAVLLANNPTVAAARAKVASAQAAARAAHVPAGPTMTLSSEYAGAEAKPWLFGVAADFPLDIGARKAARIGSADLAVAAARDDLADAIWIARTALVRGLAERLVAEWQSAVAQRLGALQERRFAVMERRVVQGEASRAELERVRADLADARKRNAAASARHDAATVQIATALGVPLEQAQRLVANWPDFEAPPSIKAIAPADRYSALLGRPELLKAITAYEQSEFDLRGEVARQYPAINVGPGFSWDHGLVKIPFNIGLALPPFDLNRHAIAAATARRSELAAQLEALYASAVASIDSALAESMAARRVLAQTRELDLPIAARLAAQADRELTSGAIDRSDWVAAQAGLEVARVNELDALARVLAADIALEEALRRPLSGPETLIEGAGS
ncbi:MAG: TolC family protein [Novosphingobium sp.]